MKDKVFIDSKKLINWIPENPRGDVEGTKSALDLIVRLLDEHEGLNIIIDLSKAKSPDKNQRAVVANTLQNNSHNVRKIALFGVSPAMKVAAFFIINAANYENMKFFESRSAAEQWLLSDN